MRILYLSHCVERNGATIALVNIIRGMLALNVEIAVIVPAKIGFLCEKMQEMKVKIYSDFNYPEIMERPIWQKGIRYYKEYIKYGVKILQVQLRVAKIIKDFRPDVVHTNTSAVDYALIGCWLTKTPHVWHLREFLDSGCNIAVFPSMFLLRKKLLLPFNYNIAITNSVFKYYKLRRKRDVVIYDGVFDAHKEFDRTPLFAFPYFISIGYVNQVKGFLSLIRQFIIFARQENSMHLIIVGNYNVHDEYYKKCMDCIKKNGMEERVHFLGVRKDVYRLIANAKALIVASPYEGFGFTCVEAMFCETLVIGHDTAGIKEQFDRGINLVGKEIGLRYNSDSELLEMLNMSLAQDFLELRNLAKKVVMDNYTVQKNAYNIYTYYQKILNHDI